MRKVLGFVIFVLLISFLFACAKKPTPVQQQGAQQPSAVKQEAQKGVPAGEEGLKGEGLEQKKVKETELKEEANVPTEEEMKILKQRIFFAFDSYDLTEDSRKRLKKKAEILLKYPNIKVVIEGHCDERGTNEYNLALGEKRARAAYEYLILLGVDADRMKTISYGEERPLDPRHNEEAWAKNRRDEFRIILK